MGNNIDGLLDDMSKKLEMATDSSSDYTMSDYEKEFNLQDVVTKTSESNAVSTDSTIKFNINFVNESDNPDPEYKTEGASGLDLRANNNEIIKLKAGERSIIPTGLYFEIPTNFEIQIRPRSGLAAKHGVTVLNTPGTIDSDYRGEIKIILINLGNEDYKISKGDRIAQAVVSTVTGHNLIDLNKVNSIDNNTDRADGGFGSTGIK